MNRSKTVTAQAGFFDLGLSIAVLALSSAFVVASETRQPENLVAQVQHVEAIAQLQPVQLDRITVADHHL